MAARNDSGACARDTAAMTAARRPLRLTIELDPDAQPPRGEILDERGEERPYVGWLALIAALEELAERARTLGAGTPSPEGGTR